MGSSAKNWMERYSPWNGLVEEEYCCLYRPFHSTCHYLSMAIRWQRSRAVKDVLPKGGTWLHARLHRQLRPVWKLFLSQSKPWSQVFKRRKIYRCRPSMTSRIVPTWPKVTPNGLIAFIRMSWSVSCVLSISPHWDDFSWFSEIFFLNQDNVC